MVTNDYKANDTYALANNDPESYLKTMARMDDSPAAFRSGEAITLTGVAMVGWSGLKRVEYWLRPDTGTHGNLAVDDPAWTQATWLPCPILPPPDDWGGSLPKGVMPKDVWGFDAKTAKPKEWPLRFSIAQWTVTLKDLKPGAYELRVRSVDLNGYAQPEPRPNRQTGRNEIQYKPIMVTG